MAADETTPAQGVASRGGAVLFDLDGTLVDSNYHHVQAWWAAFRSVGLVVPATDIHRAIGLPAREVVARLAGSPAERVVTGHEERWAPLRADVLPFAGAADLVRACAGRGLRVAFATSGSSEDVAAFRALLDVDEVVHTVLTAADVPRGKPHPDTVQVALERTGARPEDAVMVGDTVYDVQAATAARVRSIGLLAGGSCEADLRAAGAAQVHRSPAALLAALGTSLIGSLGTRSS